MALYKYVYYYYYYYYYYYNAPPDTVSVISVAVLTANHSTDTGVLQ